jgi:hypothetical protein
MGRRRQEWEEFLNHARINGRAATALTFQDIRSP